ncbi:MAG TPA: hypothetical protein ENN80_07270, partial [Candidatus Hydrogenedentes bacterium]|nr:hypothetical protein [Candidatus Hydrogenedentota bacterium]
MRRGGRYRRRRRLDVLSTSMPGDVVSWWENDTGDGMSWTEHNIDPFFDRAVTAVVADVNGDGHMDVVGVAYWGDDLVWWENDGTPGDDIGGDGNSWTKHAVNLTLDGANKVWAGDIDRDGDVDIVVTADVAGVVLWYENTNGAGTSWTEHTVDGLFEPSCVHVADVNGDGHLDILSAHLSAGDLYWWENDGSPRDDIGGDGNSWTKRLINDDFWSPRDIYAVDVDGDGDLDVVAAASTLNAIHWWENDGSGGGWTQHIVDNNFTSAQYVCATDLDADGDQDLLAVGPEAAWFENLDGAGTSWQKHTLPTSLSGPLSPHPADTDGDGDLDIIGAVSGGGEAGQGRLLWWINTVGQCSLASTDAAPALIEQGTTTDVLRIVATHNGRSGDTDMELATIELLFEESEGDPLTSAEVTDLIANLHVYRDDGDNLFDDAYDSLVTTVGSFNLVDGIEAILFGDGDPGVQVPQGTPATFFVVIELTNDAGSQTPRQFRITHVTEASSTAEDRDHDIPLTMTYSPNAGTGTMEAFAPLAFSQLPAGGLYYWDDSDTFTVSVNGGSGSYTYRWFLDFDTDRVFNPAQEAIPDMPPDFAGVTTDAFGIWLGPLVRALTGASNPSPSPVYLDIGCYVEDASGPAPPITATDTVTIMEHMYFTQDLEDAYFYTSEIRILEVAVGGGSGLYSYQWLKDTFPVGAGGPTLFFPFAEPADIGWYSCEVQDTGGGMDLISSATILLDVKNAVSIITDPTDGTYYEGPFMHQFTVAADGGYAPLTYTWFKDANEDGIYDLGEELLDDGRILGVNTTTLTINPLLATDTGDYGCYVADAQTSSATSSTATLTVVDMISTPRNPTNATDVLVHIKFIEPVNGLDDPANDVIIVHDPGGDTSHGNVLLVEDVPNLEYTITVVGVTGSDGAFSIRLRTQSEGGDMTPLDWSDTLTVGIDRIPPVIEAIIPDVPTQPDAPSNADEASFRVPFSEDVIGFDGPEDVEIIHDTSGGNDSAHTGVVIEPLGGAGDEYQLRVTGLSGEGFFT